MEAQAMKDVRLEGSVGKEYTMEEIKKLKAGEDGREILKGIDKNNIGDGVTAITGANGSGKSTLMGLAGALDSPTSGEIWYRGQRMSFENASAMNRFRAHIPAWIMQNLNLFDDQSAVENVAFSLTRYGSPYRSSFDSSFQLLAAVRSVSFIV